MKTATITLIALWFCIGCGTFRGSGNFRVGSGDYQGPGDFKTPNEYTAPESTEINEDRARLESKKIPGRNYFPRRPFRLNWPVSTIKINRGFRPATDPDHQGIDLGGPQGSAILAAHEGLVIYTGREFRGYGKMVLIEYSQEWASLYAHLNRIDVREGQIVSAGDVIGGMGKTGRASGVHLHFELLHKKQPRDPLPLLRKDSSMAHR